MAWAHEGNAVSRRSSSRWIPALVAALLFAFSVVGQARADHNGGECWYLNGDPEHTVCMHWLADGDAGIYLENSTSRGFDFWNKTAGPVTFGTSNTMRWYVSTEGDLLPAYSDTMSPAYDIGAPLNTSQARGPIGDLYMKGWFVQTDTSRLCFYGSCFSGVPQQRQVVSGSWSDGTAGQSLAHALQTYGLIVDATVP